MLEQEQNRKKRGMTFVGLLYIAYYSAVACYNTSAVLRIGFIILAGFIILDRLFSKERMKIEFPRACGMLFYFFAYCFFSRVWAIDSALASQSTSFFVSVFCLLVISVNYFIKNGDAVACRFAIAVSGIVMGIYVVVSNGGFSEFYSLATQEGVRITAGKNEMNPNTIGIICMFSVMTFLYYAIFKKKWLCYIIAVFPLIVAFATGSRKVIVLLAIGALTLILLKQKDKKGVIKYLKLIALFLIVAVAIQGLLSLEIMSTIRLRTEQLIATITGDSLNTDNSALIRAKMIEVGIEQFKETPFLGTGMENSIVLNARTLGSWTYSHNDYIEHMVNGGIVSLLLYYGTILYLIKKHVALIKVCKKPELKLSLAIMILFLVMNIAAVSYYNVMDTYLYFTLWISEVAICERELREKSLQANNEETDTDGAV